MILLCSSQREGSCMAEDDAADIEHENSTRFEEYEWCGQKRIRATTLLEGGFRGTSSRHRGSGTVVARPLLGSHLWEPRGQGWWLVIHLATWELLLAGLLCDRAACL